MICELSRRYRDEWRSMLLTVTGGAVGQQTAPAEAVSTGQDDWVLQDCQADWAFIIFQYPGSVICGAHILHSTLN